MRALKSREKLYTHKYSGYPFNSEIWYKKFYKITDEELDKIIKVDLKGSI